MLWATQTACSGQSNGDSNPDDDPNNGSDGSEGDDDDGNDDNSDDDDDNDVGESDPARQPRVLRLTHLQWENTVRDLFAFPEALGLADSFRVDPGNTFLFGNEYDALEVDEALWHGYRLAAAQVATTVTSDVAILDRVAPERASDPAAFLTRFGRSAFRRPLAGDELALFTEVFNSGATYYTDMPAADAGVRMTIETVLQSPHFLYRFEFPKSDAGGDESLVDDWTVAQRMSYLLWNSLPDEALLDAAANGGLSAANGIAEQAQRMLDDPRATTSIATFHRAAFGIERVRSAHPLADLFPNFSPRTIDDALREHDLFVDKIVHEKQGSLVDLLTSRDGAVNRELARIYGIEGDFEDDVFKPVEFDAEQRSGVLTQIAFLAGHATSADPDPIHRGAFLARHLACIPVASPPNNVPPLPDVEGMTNRQAVTAHTEMAKSGCEGCHATLINPFGFPFENYDAIGSYRTKDRGFPVNAATEVALDGRRIAVDNAIDLAQVLAQSPQVHRCYAQHWLEYAWGRRSNDRDEAFINDLAGQSQETNAPVRTLVQSIVTSDEFRRLNGAQP